MYRSILPPGFPKVTPGWGRVAGEEEVVWTEEAKKKKKRKPNQEKIEVWYIIIMQKINFLKKFWSFSKKNHDMF